MILEAVILTVRPEQDTAFSAALAKARPLIAATWEIEVRPCLEQPRQGLPMGMQIIGRHHADLSVLSLGYAYERATRWVSHHLPPVLGRARRSVFGALKNAVFLRGRGSS